MLIKPIITEKSVQEAGKNRYTFAVTPGTNKTQVKMMVEKTFGVNVIKVQTIAVVGQKYRTGKKWSFATRPTGKKAVVTLKKGQKIDLFDINPEKTEEKK